MFHKGAQMLQDTQGFEFANHIATLCVEKRGTYAKMGGHILLPKMPFFSPFSNRLISIDIFQTIRYVFEGVLFGEDDNEQGRTKRGFERGDRARED